MSEEMVTEMLGAKEVMEKLRISKPTLMRWRRTGKIKSFEFPANNYRYPKEEVERILKEGL